MKKTASIDYIFEQIELDNVVEFLNKLFVENGIDSSKQILICFENLNYKDCEEISKILRKFSESGNLFLNVTIYNKTNDAHVSIQRVPAFKKILNVFPFNIAIHVCNENVLENIRLINKTITVRFDPTALPDKCFIIFYENKNKKQSGGDVQTEKLYDFRVMETNDNKKLEETWWFKYYFSIPQCAYGRLSQSTGTCWINTILNSLFLSESTAEMLKIKYKELYKEKHKEIKKIKSFHEFLATNFPLEIILWSLVNLILIKKEKETTLSGNFMSVIASKIKSYGMYESEDYYIENNLGNGFSDFYYSFRGLQIVCDIFFKRNIDYCTIFMLQKDCIPINIYHKLYKIDAKYQEIEKNINDTNREEFFKLEKIINDVKLLDEKSSNLVKNMNEDNLISSVNWFDVIFPEIPISENDPPKIIIIPTLYKQAYRIYLSKKLHQIIYIGGIEYKLISAGICFNVETNNGNLSHVVTGLLCKSKYYIYDSNNLISYSDWNRAIYNDYIEQLGDFYQVNSYRIEYKLDYAIYIRD